MPTDKEPDVSTTATVDDTPGSHSENETKQQELPSGTTPDNDGPTSDVSQDQPSSPTSSPMRSDGELQTRIELLESALAMVIDVIKYVRPVVD